MTSAPFNVAAVEHSVNQGPEPNPWVAEIAPYTPGEGSRAGVGRVVKLSANENPLGPSPTALDAYRRAADRLAVYPDGGATELRTAVADVYGIDADRIVCGAGSDELIALLIQAYCRPGDRVLHTEHAFSMYRLSALAQGAEPLSVGERSLTADVDALLASVDARTRIVFLANPNNPTGTRIPQSEVRRLADGLPPTTLLALDGAYAEYVRDADYDAGLGLVGERSNVVVIRTFSKIYGLSALRIGWAYGPPRVVDALNRVRGPFNLSSPAIAAGAAAIRDVDYATNSAIQNEVWRDWLVKRLNAIGLETPDSDANFVVPSFGAPARAVEADSYLRANGLIVRRIDGYGLPERLRVTVGAAADNIALMDALQRFVAEAA